MMQPLKDEEDEEEEEETKETSQVVQQCHDMQQDEILALDSIYNQTDIDVNHKLNLQPKFIVQRSQHPPQLLLVLPVQLPRPTECVVETLFLQPAQVLHPHTDHNRASTLSDRVDSLPRIPVHPHLPGNPHPGSRGRGRRRSNKSAIQKTTSAIETSSPAEPLPLPTISNSRSTHFASVANASSPVDPSPSGSQRSSLIQPNASPLSSTSQSPPRVSRLPALSHLPPIQLQVRLLPRYPLEQSPVIESLQAAWLSQPAEGWIRKRLQQQYDDMGGFEIRWTWAQWLAEGMWQELVSEPTITVSDHKHAQSNAGKPFLSPQFPAKNDNPTPPDVQPSPLFFIETLSSGSSQPSLAAAMISHARLQTRTAFDSTSFDCGICLENRKGRACTRITGCGHVFCSDCLQAYLTMLVDEGFHRQVQRCPDPDCVRLWTEREKRQQADNDDVVPFVAAVTDESVDNSDISNTVGRISRWELETILTKQQIERLDRLRVKARMEADPSITYCPRSGCQAAVVRNQTDQGVWERFRQCTECGMSFCAWCTRSWHGITSCPVSFHSSLVKQYLGLAENSQQRLQMQIKYGKPTLDKLIEKYQQEEKTNQWLKNFTTPCPSCHISIEKSMGCNHMTCQSCMTHYCYLCGKSISPLHPYNHFNTPSHPCYNRLFDGILEQRNDPIDWNHDLFPWQELV